MVVFPNAKINIGLYITGKRADGYHDLCSVFYPVDLCDALEVIKAPAGSTENIQYFASGLAIDTDRNNNLCFKAYDLLKKDFPFIPPVQMHLHKVIPMGAGMGGGSADGAFCIRLLNGLFSLGLDEERMKDYALRLGSDCPFFILNRPSRVTGRGEHIEPFDLDLSGYDFLIVNPGIHVPTGWAFRHLTITNREVTLFTDIRKPVSEWKHLIINDFEEPVIEAYPVIGELKKALYDAGALYASMSGSGSTVYGIFRKGERPEIEFTAACFYKWV